MTEILVNRFDVEEFQVIRQKSEDGADFYRISWPGYDGPYELALSEGELGALMGKMNAAIFGEAEDAE